MTYKILELKNPITFSTVNKLFNDLNYTNEKFIIIDVGNHDFENIEVIKRFKEKFENEVDLINKFSKIAFLIPPEVHNRSTNQYKYEYFYSLETAIHWLKITKN